MNNDHKCSCKQAAKILADNKSLIEENANLRREIQELRGALIDQEKHITTLSLLDTECP